jgi:hypothetical protein
MHLMSRASSEVVSLVLILAVELMVSSKSDG